MRCRGRKDTCYKATDEARVDSFEFSSTETFLFGFVCFVFFPRVCCWCFGLAIPNWFFFVCICTEINKVSHIEQK